jgi:hypothetical protein
MKQLKFLLVTAVGVMSLFAEKHDIVMMDDFIYGEPTLAPQ